MHRQGQGPQALQPYEFGVKSAVVVSHKHGLMLGARTFPGNPYDGHILSAVLEQATNLTQDLSVTIRQVVADLGFRGVDTVSNGMDAPTLDGIDVPEWKCHQPLEPEGAPIPLLTGHRQPRQAHHSPRQVQEPESAAKGLAASASSRRSDT